MGLSREQCDKLRAAYFYDGIRAMPSKEEPGKFGITIPLTESLGLEPAKAFARDEKLDEGSYGVVVSLVTESETDVVAVPKFVRDFIHDFGGALDFSFTVIYSDEVDVTGHVDP
jgi:hypothetical protein